MAVTAGCLTRVYIGEIPYLKYFMDHYIGIGVDQFYFVINDKKHIGEIERIIKPYAGYYTLIIENADRNVNHSLRIDIGMIKTDYLISIDVDEFIYLENGNSLTGLLKERRTQACKMRWIMAPRDFHVTPYISGFNGKAKKKLAKTEYISGIATPHEFDYKKKVREEEYSDFHLVHYWGRGFEDVVIKCVYQNLPTKKKSSLEDMQELLKKRKLPERFRVLASLVRHEQDVTLAQPAHQIQDKDEERNLLSGVSQDFLDELKSVYINYKDNLDYDRHVAVYPSECNLLRLGLVLP